MANKIEVSNIVVDEKEIKVFVNEKQLLVNKQVQPEGRMLVDSDQLSFIYILDVEDDFIYIQFPEQYWCDLENVLQKNLPVVLQVSDNERVTLIQFEEELQYYLSNIKENSNYGEKMVQAVNKWFL